MLGGRSIQEGKIGWLLETNVISEMSRARPDPKTARWFNPQPEHALFLSILTIAEYRKGILPATNADHACSV
jgi:predicted nucleic acid-binding protein